MKKILVLVAGILFCFATVAAISQLSRSPKTNPKAVNSTTKIEGSWTANNHRWNPKKAKAKNAKENKFYLEFQYKVRKGEKDYPTINGHRFSFDEISGLTKKETEESNSEVNFQIDREAGTISCVGIFRDGKGIGEFTFTPKPSFISELKSRGVDFPERKLFSATLRGLTVDEAANAKNTNKKKRKKYKKDY